jgi:acyl carrier protein
VTETDRTDDIAATVQAWIAKEFLPKAKPGRLTPTTRLITGGILDSLATLKLAGFLEAEFGIKVEAHEASVDYLDTVTDIAAFVRSKQPEAGS